MWFKDIENRLYSRIKAILTAKYGDKYKSLNVTTNEAVYEPTALPTVHLHFNIEERGNDLDNTGINAVQMSIRVRVIVSSGQGLKVAEELSYAVMQILKEARFNVTMPGLDTDEGDTKALVSTYRRLIGANDTI